MITILRGQHAALPRHAARLASERPHALAVSPPCHPRGWNGIRQLIGQLERRDPERLARVLANHRAAVALARSDGTTALTTAEKRRYRYLSASPESHLSHNLLLQRPLLAEWATILHDLAGIAPNLVLVIPDLALLDRESLGVLRTLYRQFPDSAPSLIAGFDPERAMPIPDADGLIWENPADDVWKVAFGLLSLAGSEIRDLEPVDSVVSASTLEPLDPPPDQALDTRLLTVLARGSDVGAELVDSVVLAMRRSFEAFAFTTVLRLGIALLAPQQRLSTEQRAEIHGLVALAAHNRQFRSRGNLALADFLDRHLTVALAAETRPARRSCLCYRLAVTHGRRRKDLPAGRAWAEQALAEAASTELELWQAAHLEAWGRNILAYIEMGDRRLERANVECELAIARLEAVMAEHGEPMIEAVDPVKREVALTHALVADNIAALAKASGDVETFVRWKQQADRLAEVFPGLERFEAVLWIDLYRDKGLLSAAIPQARRGLAAARHEQDVLREYSYAAQLADLLDRVGEAESAWRVFRQAEDLRWRLGNPSFLRPLTGRRAEAALRAGHHRAARQILAQELAAEALPAVLRIRYLARLGEALARAGEEGEAITQIDAAIDLAVDRGDRDVLLEVAVVAGTVARLLDRHEEAAQAFHQALEIATACAQTPAPAALRFAALVGCCEEVSSSRSVRQALTIVPEALAEASSWWLLQRLLKLVVELADLRDLENDHELAEPLASLLAAAGQRQDCAVAAAELQRRLPTAV